MIARPNISRNEWKTTERGAFEVPRPVPAREQAERDAAVRVGRQGHLEVEGDALLRVGLEPGGEAVAALGHAPREHEPVDAVRGPAVAQQLLAAGRAHGVAVVDARQGRRDAGAVVHEAVAPEPHGAREEALD